MIAFVALGVLLVGLAVPVAGAVDFTEDFEEFELEGFNPETKPDQDWYNYFEGADVGQVASSDPVIDGFQSFHVKASATSGDISPNRGTFSLVRPTQVSAIEFHIEGVLGSAQFVALESGSPVRTMAEFYVMCNVPSSPDGCEFRVRFSNLERTGEVLVPASLNQTQFKVRVVPNFNQVEYNLFVDDIDDGTFPFLQIPRNFGHLRIGQVAGEVPMDASFDLWTVENAEEGGADVVEGDAATGLKNFATDIRFTGPWSQFLLGMVFMGIMLAAVIVPVVRVGKTTVVLPAAGFLAVLISLWLIDMGFWPDWIGIMMIIVVSALTALVMRRFILGITNASFGPSLVAGSLGYFIIAATFLAMSGYAEFSFEMPTAEVDFDPQDTEGLNETETFEQGFIEGVADCTIAIVTFGQGGNCRKEERGQVITWAADTVDNVGRVLTTIFNFAKVAFDYLFQLLSFQLPIPLIFNMMIVAPPAATMATYGLELIRGK